MYVFILFHFIIYYNSFHYISLYHIETNFLHENNQLCISQVEETASNVL